MNIKIKLDKNAQLPRLATNGSAGYDFFPKKGFKSLLVMGESVIIETGISMAIPKEKALIILSRSGHGFKFNVTLCNSVGLIDSDYRGEIKIKLKSNNYNNEMDDSILEINENTAIAQGVFIDYHQCNFIITDELEETERGENGFGSTDVKKN